MITRIAVAAPSLLATFSSLAALTSCYSPQLQECVVACTTADDCGPEQRCGADGWCAGPDRAGRCHDASVGNPGSLPGSPGELRIAITGQGQIEVSTSALDERCVSTKPSGRTCTYLLAHGTWVTLRERDGDGWRFAGWDAPGCAFGRPKSCLIRTGEAGASTTVTARFDVDVEDDDVEP